MGCHGGASDDGKGRYHTGTDHEDDTCPRRRLIQNPDLTSALTLWRSCDGVPGLEALSRYSAQAVQALSVIASGTAHRALEDAQQKR